MQDVLPSCLSPTLISFEVSEYEMDTHLMGDLLKIRNRSVPCAKIQLNLLLWVSPLDKNKNFAGTVEYRRVTYNFVKRNTEYG